MALVNYKAEMEPEVSAKEENKEPSVEEISALLLCQVQGKKAERIRAYSRENSRSRLTFDRLVQAEEALEGKLGSDAIGVGAIERVAHRIFAEAERQPVRSPFRFWKVKRAWMGFAVGTLGAILFLTSVIPLKDGFQSRSGQSMAISAGRVLQVFRVQVGDGEAISVEPAAEVLRGDHLRFAVFNEQDTCWLSIIAVDAHGARHVLLKRFNLKKAPIIQTLSIPARVPKKWFGTVKLVAVFDDIGDAELTSIKLDARDEGALSIRSVSIQVQEVDR